MSALISLPVAAAGASEPGGAPPPGSSAASMPSVQPVSVRPAVGAAVDRGGAYLPLYAKASAILGGAPSRLQQIAAEQSALAGRGAGDPPLTTGAGVAVPSHEPVAHSGPAAASAEGLVGYRPAARLPSFQSAAASSASPDMFGMAAVAIGQSPLRARWRTVAHDTVAGTPWAQAARPNAGETRLDHLARVNAWVNAQTEFADDARLYGKADHWASAAETLRRGRGDCEDYAIAKLQLLRASGVDADDMFLVIARDLVRRADHALLVVQVDGRRFVLDNNTDAVVDAQFVQDYRPIVTYSGNRSWTYGHRRQPPGGLQLASAR